MVKTIFSKTDFFRTIFQSARNSHKVLPRTFKNNHKEISWFISKHGPVHPRWGLESYVPPEKTVHDVMDSPERVVYPREKQCMTSWTGWQFLKNPVSSLSPGFRVRILRPSEKGKPDDLHTSYNQHDNHPSCPTMNLLFQQLMIIQPKFLPHRINNVLRMCPPLCRVFSSQSTNKSLHDGADALLSFFHSEDFCVQSPMANSTSVKLQPTPVNASTQI